MSAHNDDIDAEFQSLPYRWDRPAAATSPSLDPDDTLLTSPPAPGVVVACRPPVLALVSYRRRCTAACADAARGRSCVPPWDRRVAARGDDAGGRGGADVATGQRPMPDAVDRACAVSNLPGVFGTPYELAR